VIHDEYTIGELVEVRLFGETFREGDVFTCSYVSYGIIINFGLSPYDSQEGYYVFVQKTSKIKFYKPSWIKKIKKELE
jgi:hypothetical protein